MASRAYLTRIDFVDDSNVDSVTFVKDYTEYPRSDENFAKIVTEDLLRFVDVCYGLVNLVPMSYLLAQLG